MRCSRAKPSTSRDRRGDQPGRPDRPRQLPGRGGRELAVLLLVPDGGTEEQRLLGERHRVVEAQRGEQPLAHRLVPRLAGDLLDHPAQQGVAGVAVGPGGAERVVLTGLAEHVDVLLQAVVAAAGVGEHVAVDAAGVGEQVPQGHLLGDVGVRQPQLGQHLGDRAVELEQPLVDQHHRDGGGPHLGDRPDLEDGVRGGGRLGADVEHAVRRLEQLVGSAIDTDPEDAELGAGHAVPLGEPGQPLLPVGRRRGAACRRRSVCCSSHPSTRRLKSSRSDGLPSRMKRCEASR